jgi:hypothetical protein|eukprot:COSAG02_NODE_3624_length_6453_cov_7.466793_4_plen_170_part_00
MHVGAGMLAGLHVIRFCLTRPNAKLWRRQGEDTTGRCVEDAFVQRTRLQHTRDSARWPPCFPICILRSIDMPPHGQLDQSNTPSVKHSRVSSIILAYWAGPPTPHSTHVFIWRAKAAAGIIVLQTPRQEASRRRKNAHRLASYRCLIAKHARLSRARMQAWDVLPRRSC